MAKYRKKPVEVEAVQWLPGETHSELEMSTFVGLSTYSELVTREGDDLKITTLEGTMSADPGDYVIRGVKGELYPIKPDIFEATYTKVDDAEA